MLEWIYKLLGGQAPGDLTAFRFEFANLPLAIAGWLLVIAAGVWAARFVWKRTPKLPKANRWLVSLLRAGVMALALFLALDPQIVADQIKPGEDYVLVLYDDSQSMRIKEQDGLTRAERLVQTAAKPEVDFEARLKKRFNVVNYRFGEEVERVPGLKKLDFSRPESDPIAAVQQAARDMGGARIAAVALISDGVRQSDAPPRDADSLKALGFPVFTFGAGMDSAWSDLELTDITVRRTEFDKSPVSLTIRGQATGLAGKIAVAEAVLGDEIVDSREINIESADQPLEALLEFIPREKDWLGYTARLHLKKEPPPQAEPGVDPEAAAADAEKKAAAELARDQIAENNERAFAVDNRQREYRILYFGGRPNWQNKFIRRALDEDPELKLTSVLRISKAEQKFVFRGQGSSMVNPLVRGFNNDDLVDQPRYDESIFIRFGANEGEFEKGYPIRAEDLFGFNLVIWAEIEHNFFSQEHLEVTRDFVRKRGGSLLMLGGPYSFSEGGYTGTILEGMLPVLLNPAQTQAGDVPKNLEDTFKANPTLEGELTGAWSLSPVPDENKRIWETSPAWTGLNLFPVARAGASVMARAKSEAGELNDQPVYIEQRYGEGRAAALATAATWEWQMNPEVPLDDDSHERLWRQIVRSLTHDVPQAVALRGKKDSYPIDQEIEFETIIRSKAFDPSEGLNVEAKVVSPTGQEQPVSIDESIQEPGIYKAGYTPHENGMHLLSLEARDEADTITGTLSSEAFVVEPDLREFRHAKFNPDYLRSIADATGGKYYPVEKMADAIEKLPYEKRDESDRIRFRLWHWPAFFFLFVGMLSVEWFIRRRRGYA